MTTAERDVELAMAGLSGALAGMARERAARHFEESTVSLDLRTARKSAEALPGSNATDALCDCIDVASPENFGTLITELGRILDAAIAAGVKVEDV